MLLNSSKMINSGCTREYLTIEMKKWGGSISKKIIKTIYCLLEHNFLEYNPSKSKVVLIFYIFICQSLLLLILENIIVGNLKYYFSILKMCKGISTVY